MMTWGDMQKVMPMFFNMSIAVHNDAEASKEWGWVQVRRCCWLEASRGCGAGACTN
jgi:hypothetical protein